MKIITIQFEVPDEKVEQAWLDATECNEGGTLVSALLGKVVLRWVWSRH